MKIVTKQNEFKQSMENEAKLGAYYTDPQHCDWISNFLAFPQDREVCCIDPAIGNGEAIMRVTKNAGKKLVFGVELNRETCSSVIEREGITECLAADFLTGVLISHHVFSFAFVNPPYGVLEQQRQEILFLNKLKPYLTCNAVVVYVVPAHVSKDPQFLKHWCTTFDTYFLYRFHEQEYKKWKQVVFIGKATRRPDNRIVEMKRVMELVEDAEQIPLLPVSYSGEKLEVPPSQEEKITTFMTKEFDVEKAKKCLKDSLLTELVKKKIKVKKNIVYDLPRPIIIPSDGQMYLLAVSGAGQGQVGSDDSGDLHLQRGVVKNVQKSEYRESENGKVKEVVTQHSQISYCLIENSGKVTTLN